MKCLTRLLRDDCMLKERRCFRSSEPAGIVPGPMNIACHAATVRTGNPGRSHVRIEIVYGFKFLGAICHATHASIQTTMPEEPHMHFWQKAMSTTRRMLEQSVCLYSAKQQSWSSAAHGRCWSATKPTRIVRKVAKVGRLQLQRSDASISCMTDMQISGLMNDNG